MANPHHHTVSSIRKFKLHGPKGIHDYPMETYEVVFQIHNWFDETKAHLADFRHRALRHHAEGIFLCEKIFGPFITIADGRQIPTRWIAEQHVTEDLGRIPSAADWLREIKPRYWMSPSTRLHLELDEQEQQRAQDYDETEASLYPNEESDNEALLNQAAKRAGGRPPSVKD